MEKSLFLEKYPLVMKANGLDSFADAGLAEAFWRLSEHMLAVNEHMNLTAITDLDGILVKHYADSLTAAAFLPEGARIIDIGCGAGFPSLPLAIARPDLNITSVDSTAKRIRYLNETAEILGLTNITGIAARAEELSHDPAYREVFDISCARAVARLNVLSELCLPFVRTGGRFIAMKADAADEIAESDNAIRKLGGDPPEVHTLTLISDNASIEPSRRTIVCVKKISKTPANYPRNHSQIKKKPL